MYKKRNIPEKKIKDNLVISQIKLYLRSQESFTKHKSLQKISTLYLYIIYIFLKNLCGYVYSIKTLKSCFHGCQE